MNLGLTMSSLKQSLIAFFLAIILSLVVWKLLCVLLKNIKILNHSIYLPIDILNTKFTEIVFAIPSYFIILAFSSFLGNSMWAIILVLALTSWPQSALLMRAELLRIREMNYINALKLSGIGPFRILIKHAIPNAISPLLVNFVFFVSGLLIVESTLSYIGIGLSADIATWGKVISSFKHNTANWWVAFFPGIIIFLTILSIHKIGNWLEKKLL
jgi:peptide/nickel transport system permease protein